MNINPVNITEAVHHHEPGYRNLEYNGQLVQVRIRPKTPHEAPESGKKYARSLQLGKMNTWSEVWQPSTSLCSARKTFTLQELVVLMESCISEDPWQRHRALRANSCRVCVGSVFRIVLALTAAVTPNACYHICTILQLEPSRGECSGSHPPRGI